MMQNIFDSFKTTCMSWLLTCTEELHTGDFTVNSFSQVRAGSAQPDHLFVTVKVWLMRLPTQRQQTGARFYFKGSASPFRLQNDRQKTNFGLCHSRELWSTRQQDRKCQWHKPGRGEKVLSICCRGIKQNEEDPNNPRAGGGFTFSSTLPSPLRRGVAAPVFGWHVSIISAFQAHILCAERL